MCSDLDWLSLRGLVGREPRLILLETGSYRSRLWSWSRLWSLVGVTSSAARAAASAASCLAAISCSAASPTFPTSFFSPPLPDPTTYLELRRASFSWSSFILEGLVVSETLLPSAGGTVFSPGLEEGSAGSLLRSRLVLSALDFS